MTSERIATLCILTAIMFGFTNYLQFESFLLPIGIFKIGLFIAAVIMCITEFVNEPILAKRNKWRYSIVLSWTLLFAFTSVFIHQLLFSEEYYLKHKDFILNISSLLYFIGILVSLVWQTWAAFSDKTFLRWLQIANACAMACCLTFNLFDWLIVPSTMWIVILVLSKTIRSFDRGVALLYYFVLATTWLTGFFLGANSVYNNL